ncbi:MAG TPA: phytanoyl-CoA dioxygenase family protein [Candidatus Obscuribacterales bacterium]
MISVESLLEQAKSPEFWRRMNPHLSISEDLNFKSQPSITVEQEHLKNLLFNLKEEGYFQIDSILPASEVLPLAAGIEKLCKSGWPPVFAFIYDQSWQIFYRLSPILSAVLGEDYRQIADVWAWNIETSKRSRGWEPHRDRRKNSLLPDGMPKALNIWIPLTDATPLNGCMYILPADLDPNYSQDSDTVGINPQDIRALPVSVGSVLCWNPVVWHWGGRSSDKATSPRINLACDFQRADVEPYEMPLLDPAAPLNFNQRLGLIAKLLLRFQKRYGFSAELVELAVELQKNAPIPYWAVGSYYRVLSDRWSSVGIAQGALVQISHLYDNGKLMVRHPDREGVFYPFEPLELEDVQLITGV